MPATTSRCLALVFSLFAPAHAQTANTCPPCAPSNLAVGVVSATQLNLAWRDNSTDETGFQIERRTAGGAFARVATVGANISAFADTRLTPCTTYTYRVRAFRAQLGANNALLSEVDSLYTNEAAGTTLPGVAAVSLSPASVTGASPATGTVTLTCPAPAGGVVVALSSGSPAVAAVSSPVMVLAGATTATFSVTTTAVALSTPVVISATANGVGQSATLTVLPPRLTALAVNPTQVNVGSGSTGTVTLNGPAPAGGAAIQLSSSSPLASAPASVTVAAGQTAASFTVTTQDVVDGLQQPVTVTLTGSFAGDTRMATLTVLPLPPAAPSNLAVTVVSQTQLNLAWRDNGTNETGFEIERRTGNAAFARIAVVAANTITYADTGLTPSTTYIYRVRAFNAGGASAYSNEASGTTLAPPPVIKSVAQQIAVFRQSTCEWCLRGDDSSVTVVPLGRPGDQPVAADYLGAGQAQIAVFRPAVAEWLIRRDDGGTIALQFGGPGDVPAPADYLALRRTQIALFRPATGEWFLRRDDGTALVVPFGGASDVPAPADYFGLRRAQIAVFRPATGEWFLRADSGAVVEVPWGTAGDVSVPGDYLGLGRAQIAVFRPSTAEWFIRNDRGEAIRIPFGAAGDVPVPGDYTGVGRAQIAVFRPATREWFLRTNSGATLRIQFGGPGDQPVPARYTRGAGTP